MKMLNRLIEGKEINNEIVTEDLVNEKGEVYIDTIKKSDIDLKFILKKLKDYNDDDEFDLIIKNNDESDYDEDYLIKIEKDGKDVATYGSLPHLPKFGKITLSKIRNGNNKPQEDNKEIYEFEIKGSK